MVKKLRRKFIAITMLAVIGVLALLIGTINVINYRSVCDTADERIEFIAERGVAADSDRPDNASPGKTDPGQISQDRMDPKETNPGDMHSEEANPEGEDPKDLRNPDDSFRLRDIWQQDALNEESVFDTRYFVVSFDADGNVTEVNADNIAAIDEAEAEEVAEKLLSSDNSAGFYREYRYMRSESETGGVTYILMDASRELASFKSFRNASIFISILGIVLVFILVTVISGYVTRPMTESYVKQKQFITEASHEIKTPIAIIQANTEVIEIENGESDWTRGITNQTRRLKEMTENLVLMSRMEEDQPLVLAEDVDLSALVESCLEDYDAPIIANDKNLVKNITPDLHLTGDAKALSKMLSLLMDNAIKYSTARSDIEVALKKSGRKKVLSISNGVEGMENGKHDELFGRFYRADESHNSRTGGQGIGLATVSSIVTAHGGSTHAVCADNKLTFQITL